MSAKSWNLSQIVETLAFSSLAQHLKIMPSDLGLLMKQAVPRNGLPFITSLPKYCLKYI